MSLFSIPFFSSLVGQDIGGVKLTTSYVLFIGAIVAHSQGKLNCCVASLETLAEEIGSTVAKVRNIRSDLIRVGVVEVIGRDRSGFITSIRFLGDINFGKVELKAFNEKLKGIQQKVETVTEVETGVGYNIIDTKEEGGEEERERNEKRMSPATLYTRLKSIYHIRRDADKKGCIKSVEKLQEVFDDDVIIDAAIYFYSERRLHPKRFDDGKTWWPDFFWVLRKDKFDRVVEEIKKVPNLFTGDDTPTESKGYMEGISWNG